MTLATLSEIDAHTPAIVASGIRVLQTYRFAEGEFAHIRRLLAWFEPPINAKVIDLGCGVGEVARVMKSLAPDLSFTLCNVSQVQLSFCPEDCTQCLCDFANVPMESECFDCATFMFSIGHADLGASLREAHRLLRRGGILFVVDMARISGDNSDMRRLVSYQVHTEDAFRRAANEAGFSEDFCMKPQPLENLGPRICGSEKAYEEIFRGVEPIVWRFIKQ